MRIMPLIAAVSLCAASAAASGTNIAFSHKAASETLSERCEGEVREMAQVFRLRLQVMQPDLLELMTLDRPADQLKRIKAVYSIDMRGYGPATLAQAEALLQMHFELCKNSA
ncbi:p54 [Xanthomonas phage Xop411]|uniref:p54 n=1 Tax=Xanthomonas phage Xop411 TaxID=2913975 RepID=A5H1J4_9CAUD|nr:p54 [Xanthomonas phage Xop411]ABK00198.1 p54 [Xanthomonas phage Xop411]